MAEGHTEIDHYHCPHHGDRPKAQPRWADGKYMCMYCAVILDRDSEMVACTPDTCPEEV